MTINNTSSNGWPFFLRHSEVVRNIGSRKLHLLQKFQLETAKKSRKEHDFALAAYILSPSDAEQGRKGLPANKGDDNASSTV